MSYEPETPTTGRIAEKARTAANDMADAAGSRAKNEAETARDTAAAETEKAADAAHAAAGEFDPDSMQAQAIEKVAEQVEAIAAQIRSTDIDRLARTVGDAAQRNPLMFVAGAALAGFAVTRFLKARDPYPRSYGQSRPYSDNGARPTAQDDVWRMNDPMMGEG